MARISVPIWQRLTVGRNPKHTLIRLAVLVVVTVVIFKYVLIPTRVVGISMQPNYLDGQVKFVNRLAYLFHEPRRGDVVATRIAGKRVYYLKRIIALPGERFGIKQGVVYINGAPLEEPYLNSPHDPWNYDEKAVPPGQYVLIGDNRSMDIDLHEWGFFPRDRIAGKVIR